MTVAIRLVSSGVQVGLGKLRTYLATRKSSHMQNGADLSLATVFQNFLG